MDFLEDMGKGDMKPENCSPKSITSLFFNPLSQKCFGKKPGRLSGKKYFQSRGDGEGGSKQEL